MVQWGKQGLGINGDANVLEGLWMLTQLINEDEESMGILMSLEVFGSWWNQEDNQMIDRKSFHTNSSRDRINRLLIICTLDYMSLTVQISIPERCWPSAQLIGTLINTNEAVTKAWSSHQEHRRCIKVVMAILTGTITLVWENCHGH